jgi:RNA polymerase sigma-70 factor (ECF subfamily)
MSATEPDASTNIRSINDDARNLYLAWKRNEITKTEYEDSIVRLVWRQLDRFIWNGLGVANRANRDDIFQEVMLRFFASQPDLSRPLTLVLNWLFKVAANLKIDHWRKRRHEEELVNEDRVPASDAPLAAGGNITPEFNTLRLAVEHMQVLEITVRDALLELPEEWRTPVYLCLALRFTQEAAAEIVNLPETTVNYYVGMAARRLKSNARLKEFASQTVRTKE